jgi:hypothetical protein
MDPTLDAPPRKKLKILEPLIVSVLVCGVYSFFVPSILIESAQSRESTAAHLIDQLSQATKAYELDYAVYPPGDGFDSRRLVECLQRRTSKNRPYLDFSSDMLSGGSVVNPVFYEETKIIHYLSPGVRHPSSFDLWAEDSRGNPQGINNWE